VRAEVKVCFGFGEERNRENRREDSLKGPVRTAAPKRATDASEVAAAWDEALRLGASSGSGASLSSFLRKSSSLSDRLIQLILAESGVVDQPLARLPRDARRRVAETLAAFPLPATGTEGYRTAEVTGGGVALDEVDPGSGKSKVVPGLWLAGEVLDAFGPIGGFNFQWAWGTGWTAGESAARA
jgi:predicted flavoprotein YhiN